IDSRRFERLAAEGRAALFAEDAELAARHLSEAEELWRGPALVDVVYAEFAAHEAARLEELRLSTFEDLADAELAIGGHEQLIPRLQAFVAAQPLRERARAQLMLALYRDGRQSDALASDEHRSAVFVDLSHLSDPGLVASTIANALRLSTGGRPLEEALADHLAHEPPLLVLDNFEQLTEAAPLLGRLLTASPELQLL